MTSNLDLLKNFITLFLPRSNNKRKYSHNEFSFIHNTIAKIFVSYANIKISDHELAKCFTELNYNFYVREGQSGLFKNENKRSSKKKNKRIPFFDFDEGVFVYIAISSETVIHLRRASNSMAYQKNASKLLALLPLKEKITFFFKTTQHDKV